MDYVMIYDNNNENYFLILKSIETGQWGILTMNIADKQNPQDEIFNLINRELGIKLVKSLKKVDDAEHNIYLVETNMNLPTTIDLTKYTTYNWSKAEDASAKIIDPVLKSIFVETLYFLKS